METEKKKKKTLEFKQNLMLSMHFPNNNVIPQKNQTAKLRHFHYKMRLNETTSLSQEVMLPTWICLETF